MQILKALAILCFTTFTAFGQCKCDTLDCFTKEQSKTFLRTKVEFNNCLKQFNKVMVKNDSITLKNSELIEEQEKKEKKLKRTRWIGGGIGLAAILEGFILIVKK